MEWWSGVGGAERAGAASSAGPRGVEHPVEALHRLAGNKVAAALLSVQRDKPRVAADPRTSVEELVRFFTAAADVHNSRADAEVAAARLDVRPVPPVATFDEVARVQDVITNHLTHGRDGLHRQRGRGTRRQPGNVPQQLPRRLEPNLHQHRIKPPRHRPPVPGRTRRPGHSQRLSHQRSVVDHRRN